MISWQKQQQKKKLCENCQGSDGPPISVHVRRCFWWLSNELGKYLTRQAYTSMMPEIRIYSVKIQAQNWLGRLFVENFPYWNKRSLWEISTHKRERKKPKTKGRWKACSDTLCINTILLLHSTAKIWFSVCSELCQFFSRPRVEFSWAIM